MPRSILVVLILLCMEPIIIVLSQADMTNEGDVQSNTELPQTTDLTTESGLSLCGMTAYKFNRSCCFSIGPTTTYMGAQEKCMNYSGHLVKLSPLSIYIRLQELYDPNQIPDSWIGLAQHENATGVYIWDLDDTEVVHTNWDVYEPTEVCVYVDGGTGKWKTAPCDSFFDAICCVPEDDFVDVPDCSEFGCIGENIDCVAGGGCVCDGGYEFANDNKTMCEVVSDDGTENTTPMATTESFTTVVSPTNEGTTPTVEGTTSTAEGTTPTAEGTTPSEGTTPTAEEETTVEGTTGVPDCINEHGCKGENIDCELDKGCICAEGYEFTDDTETECQEITQESPTGEDCVEEFGCEGENIYCDPDEGCVCDEGYEFTDDTETECQEITQESPTGEDCVEEFGCEGENIDCDPDEGCVCDEGYEFTDDTETECQEKTQQSPTDEDCVEEYGCEGENIDCDPDEGCVCDMGYEFTDDTKTECQDVNECARGLHNCNIPENYVCLNEAGGFACECRDGYTEDQTEGKCLQKNQCTPQDDTCDEPEERCARQNGVFVCICGNGLDRNPVTSLCENINECESGSDPCAFFTNTQCIDLNPVESNALFRCDCKQNYIPDTTRQGHCIKAPDAVLCQQLDCQNGGTCFVDESSEVSCSCTDNFEGETCGSPRNLKPGTPAELTQGLMIGAIVTAATLLGLLATCCCLCACLPCCRPAKQPPPPPRPVARPWAIRRPYVVYGESEQWFLEQRYDEEAHEAYDEPVEEIREVLRPVEEERHEWHLARSDLDDEISVRENQRMGLFRRAMDRATRNPLSSHSNLGYQQAPERGSDRSEISVPYMADGSLNA